MQTLRVRLDPNQYQQDVDVVALALPKLNLQFLTLHDYLLRNLTLFRLESTYEIRQACEWVNERMCMCARAHSITHSLTGRGGRDAAIEATRRRGRKHRVYGLVAHGDAHRGEGVNACVRALSPCIHAGASVLLSTHTQAFAVVSVGQPLLGEPRPGYVKADVRVNFASVREDVMSEASE